MRDLIESIEREYRRYKGYAEGTFDQLVDDQLAHVPAADGNSVAILVSHIAGNLKSRFTDFLTSDGEKPWRQRESEFDEKQSVRVDFDLKNLDQIPGLISSLGEIDALVNNAGVLYCDAYDGVAKKGTAKCLDAWHQTAA